MGRHKLSYDEIKAKLKDASVDIQPYEDNSNFTYNDWVQLAHKHALLSEYEQESMLPMDFTVVKTHLWTHLKEASVRDCIDEVVELVTRMYTVGTRFLGAWVLENESHLEDEAFFKETLKNDTFLKHAFRGRLDKGTIHESIAQSNAFREIEALYPSIKGLKDVLPDMTAWNNLVGSIVSTYKESLSLHVRLHMWTRVQGHIKRHACRVLPGAKIVTKDKQKTITWDGGSLTLGALYGAITDEKKCETLPDDIQTEVRHIATFMSPSVRKVLANKVPERLTNDLFRLHLYMRSHVPFELVTDEKQCEDEVLDLSKVEEARDDDVPVQMKACKGWSPVPISKLGRVHITIDESKVLPAIVKKCKLNKNTTLSSLLGIDRASLKAKREDIRKRIRRMNKKHTTQEKKKRSRARKSAKNNGLGLMMRLASGAKPRSVQTDGVSLCIRYAQLAIKKPEVKLCSLKEFKESTNARLMANDPGRVNLFQLVEERSDHKHSCMRFPRSKYRVVGLGEELQRRRAARKTQDVNKVEGLLAQVGGWRARSYESYIEALRVFNTHGDALIQHYSQKVYVQEKMLSYRRRQSVIIQRFANFIDRDNLGEKHKHDVTRGIILGMGNASFAPSGKGETPVPTTRNGKLFERYLRSRSIPYRIVPIDEYKTSQCCHRCQKVMASLWDKETHRAIRGWKLCRHCGEDKANPKLRNRDVNAAINILHCLMAVIEGAERPCGLRRPPLKEKKAAATS